MGKWPMQESGEKHEYWVVGPWGLIADRGRMQHTPSLDPEAQHDEWQGILHTLSWGQVLSSPSCWALVLVVLLVLGLLISRLRGPWGHIH